MFLSVLGSVSGTHAFMVWYGVLEHVISNFVYHPTSPLISFPSSNETNDERRAGRFPFCTVLGFTLLDLIGLVDLIGSRRIGE